MNIWILLLFSILQGALEWLPISSSGQIINLLTWLDINPSVAFSLSLWLHLGTLLSVTIVYRNELYNYIKYTNRDENIVQWRWFIVISTLGTAITGIPCFIIVYVFTTSALVGDYITLMIGIALLVTSGFLYYSGKQKKEGIIIINLSKKKMLIVGLIQGFAIIPGISRAGITMAGLLFMNIDKRDAIKGSFLMSIPAVMGGFILELGMGLFRGIPLLVEIEWWHLMIAIIVTAIVGLLTIEFLLYISKNYNFAIVCFALGGIIVLLFLVFLFI